jgi:hypothetical protein
MLSVDVMSVAMFCAVMQRIIILTSPYAECGYIKCCNAECRSEEFYYDQMWRSKQNAGWQ